MLNSNTAVLCRILHPDAQKALLDWFATLSERMVNESTVAPGGLS